MSRIQDDKLIRKTPVQGDSNGSVIAIKNVLVITKEEFLMCYKEWVLKPMRPESAPFEFGIPVDNDGCTPVQEKGGTE